MKEIKGYESYTVCKEGTVFSKKSDRLLKLTLDHKGSGYMRVGLCREGRTRIHYVHRIVAIAHIPNPDNKPQVNHIDGDKTNNLVENLEWVTQDENIKHAASIGLMARGSRHTKSKLSEDNVREIRELLGKKTYMEIAEIYGVCFQSIALIKNGTNWSHLK